MSASAIQNASSPRATPSRKRQRVVDSDDENDFHSRAKVKNRRTISLRKDRKKPQRFGDSQMVNSYDMEIDEFDNAEKAEFEKINELKKAGISALQIKRTLSLGNFQKLPVEIICHIIDYLDNLPDIISTINTCHGIRQMLGPNNNLKWFQYGKDLNVSAPKFDVYDPKNQYFQQVSNFAGFGKPCTRCQLCFGKTQVVNYTNSLKMRLCNKCVEENVIPVTEVRCIEGLELEKLRYFTTDNEWRHGARDRFPHNINRSDSCPAFYLWKPMVMRRLSKLYPGQTYESIIQKAETAQNQYKHSVKRRQQACWEAVMMDAKYFGLEAYKALLEHKYAGKPELSEKLNKATELPQIVVDNMNSLLHSKYNAAFNENIQLGRKIRPLDPDTRENWAKNIVFEAFFSKVGFV